MATNDSICLQRSQWIDVCRDSNRRQLIVDHPLNAPMLGSGEYNELLRSSDFFLQSGDQKIIVRCTNGGEAHRVATALVEKRRGGRLCLTSWQMEPGFVLQSETHQGHVVHKVVRAQLYGQVPKPTAIGVGAMA